MDDKSMYTMAININVHVMRLMISMLNCKKNLDIVKYSVPRKQVDLSRTLLQEAFYESGLIIELTHTFRGYKRVWGDGEPGTRLFCMSI